MGSSTCKLCFDAFPLISFPRHQAPFFVHCAPNYVIISGLRLPYKGVSNLSSALNTKSQLYSFVQRFIWKLKIWESRVNIANIIRWYCRESWRWGPHCFGSICQRKRRLQGREGATFFSMYGWPGDRAHRGSRPSDRESDGRQGNMLLMPSVDTSSVGVSSSMAESPGVADHYRYIQSGPTRELHHVLSEHLHAQPGTPAPWHPLRVRRLRRRAPPLAASTHVLVA